jgi:ribonuclease P protein subunit POP4
MRTKDLLRQELIGLDIEIVGSTNKSLQGLKGKVIDETKNTLVIEMQGNTKRILKNQIALKCVIAGVTARINGRQLVGRSEERLKK